MRRISVRRSLRLSVFRARGSSCRSDPVVICVVSPWQSLLRYCLSTDVHYRRSFPSKWVFRRNVVSVGSAAQCMRRAHPDRKQSRAASTVECSVLIGW